MISVYTKAILLLSVRLTHIKNHGLFTGGGGGGGGGGGLVNCVPMREQRTAKLTLNSVCDILKLIPLFTVSSQKVSLSNVVN